MCNSKLYWTLSYFSFWNYWYISISALVSLTGIPMGITSSVIGLKIRAITAEIKKYRSVIKKKKKKHDEIVLLAKSNLNSVEVLISKAWIDSVISHEDSVLIDNELKEYNKNEKITQKFEDLNSSSKILVQLLCNVIILFEVSKTYRK